MKEEEFKSLIREGESAYDPKAWDAMQQRLDQLMPVKKPPFSTSLSKLIWTSSILFVGSGIFLLMNQAEENPAKTKKQELEQLSKPEYISDATTSKQPVLSANKQTEKTASLDKTQAKQELSIPEKQNSISHPVKTENKQQSFKELLANNLSSKLSEEETQLRLFILPQLEDSYCVGQVVKMNNKNQSQLAILHENKLLAEIQAGAVKEIQLSEAGVYYFRYARHDEARGEQVTEKAFRVKSGRELEISYQSDVNYDNGLPYIQLSSEDFNEHARWSSDKGQILTQEKNTLLRTFEKGNYTIKLIKEEENHCTSSATAHIEVREAYNLMAVNAFVPNHSDSRKNRFMPEALKYRQTAFTMIIIDPRDNHTVFKTNSTDQSWDGIDQASGQQVEHEKIFIWKVSIKNPEPGEKPEYSGTIMSLETFR